MPYSVMVDATNLKAALERWCAAMQAAAPELNSLDGQLGDGDLGATLEKCAANISAALPTFNNTISDIFRACALASSKASGSSFGTLLSIAFLTASNQSINHQHLDRESISAILSEIVTTLSARGGASLGDKTLLDPIDAVAKALAATPDTADLKSIAVSATKKTLEAFRNHPNKIGRARIYAERSIGLDDPGMVAFNRMVESL